MAILKPFWIFVAHVVLTARLDRTSACELALLGTS